MAYFQKKNEDDQNNNGNQNQITGGNIYSTSGSEVSSTLENSSPKGNSTSSLSNESGNWVNLNKYLDANQGKVGGYVDTLVNPYSQKEEGYRNNLQNANEQYLNSIHNDTAYKTGANTSRNIASNYYKNSSNVSDDDKGAFYGTLSGYQGAGKFDETGDDYGYNDLRTQADEFANVSSNLGNNNYLQSLMGNQVSSGGKKLNSFLVQGTTQGQQDLNNNVKRFSDLENLLNNQVSSLNDERQNVINTATQNQQLAQQAEAEEYKRVQDQIAAAQQKAIQKANQQKALYEGAKNNVMHVGLPTSNGQVVVGKNLNINPYTWKDTSTQGKQDVGREQKELDQRRNDLLNNTRTADSSLDTNFKYADFSNAYNGKWQEKQDAMNRVLNNVYNSGTFGKFSDNDRREILDEVLNDYYTDAVDKAFMDFYNNKISENELGNKLQAAFVGGL